MCRLSGIRLNKITMASDENTAGSCGYEKMIRGKYPETDNSDRMRLKLEKRAMIAPLRLVYSLTSKVYTWSRSACCIRTEQVPNST
jgi:hypothetical protein